MRKHVEFNFGDDSIAKAYDTILVPTLFESWAQQLILENRPWPGEFVLDLACGTGVVTKELARNVGPTGKVIAMDFSRQMLDLARVNCTEWENIIDYIEGSADEIALLDHSVDKVVCQQGFQFFPNKKKSAQEIFRVLKPNGKAVISTWCPVSECELFGVICDTLEAMNLDDVSQMMRVPFDSLSQDELLESFSDIGFSTTELSRHEQKLVIGNGADGALLFTYATPIGPKLRALESDRQEEFKVLFNEKIRVLIQTDGSIGRMVTNLLTLEK